MNGAAPLPRRAALSLWLVFGACGAALFGLVGYEAVALDWHPAREEAPGWTGWHWLRALLTGGLAAWLIATLHRAGRQDDSLAPLSQSAIAIAVGSLALAIGATVVFLASPALFHTGASEDGVMEWLSVVLLIIGCGFFVAIAGRELRGRARPRRWLHLIAALGFALLFFLMFMEEISWGQRIIGFATPEQIAAQNWQGEFNLHNFQTDLSELAFYFATGIFLLLLPLMRESVGDWRVLAPFRALLPDRAAFAAAAPMLILTYSHWNLLPIQAIFWIGLIGCSWFALRAAQRGWRGEVMLFTLLLATIAIGQTLFLLFGHRTPEIFDSSEYRELFIGLGLAVYGWRQWSAVKSAG